MLTEIILKLKNLEAKLSSPETDLIEFRRELLSAMEQMVKALEVVNNRVDELANGKLQVFKEDVIVILENIEREEDYEHFIAKRVPDN